MNSPRPVPKRIVKPRQPGNANFPIIAIDRDKVLLENGEVHSFTDLPALIRTLPSSIVVAHHFGGIIRYLDSEFTNDPLWQYKAKPIERTAWSPNRQHNSATQKDCVIGYFGFKSKSHKKGEKGTYFYPLSPNTFCLKTINELRKTPTETDTIVRLMEWAKEVRAYLIKQKLNISPTAGGIAAQLLRDERFYPKARRKVPRKTNAKVREYLPGNFYRLYEAREGIGVYSAAYIDQRSAHHNAAAKVRFPNANTLRRRGHYSTLKDKAIAKYGTDTYKNLISQYGLFYLAIETPRFSKTDFPLPECDGEPGYKRGFFYSNELPYLQKLGVRIRHIIAMWTSPDIDMGLSRYAEWALEEISNAERLQKPWLKPALLSAYGILAAKPKILEFGYKQCEGGEEKRYPCGSGFLTVQAKSTKKLLEPVMANVLHRGLVEAQTRLTSLEFARTLAKQNYTILAIYADSVFIEGGKQLPLLPYPWRIQNFLTGLKFQSSTHFTSAQLSKTPGVPLWLRDRAKLPPRPNRKATAST